MPLAGGPTVTVPLAGDYEIECGGYSQQQVDGAHDQNWALGVNGVQTGAIAHLTGTTYFSGGQSSVLQRLLNLAAGTALSLMVNAGANTNFGPGWLSIQPTRVG